VIAVEKVLFLRHVSLFATIPTRELGHMAGITEEIVYPAGSSIFAEGDRGDSMFLVVEGEVAIHSGKVRIATIREEGYFGEMSILDDEPRSASAAAESDCLLLRIKRDDFHGILASHFDATLAIIKTLTRRLRDVASVARQETKGEKTLDQSEKK
jgi:CRP/FNR family transcriptional regulator, cyclic AMP receptor protein